MPRHWEIPHLFNSPEGKRMNPLVNVLTPRLRGYLYAAYALAGVTLGALTIAGVPTGKTAEVLAYLGVALGLTAASNASPTYDD